MKKTILLIYTGGTIGMVRDAQTGSLYPFELGKICDAVPVLQNMDCEIDSYCFDPIIDSSNMKPEYWVKLACVIKDNYEKYDGFVVLHGTDTMSFTASALSFMLQNLSKPIVITGSQLPLGMVRTDGLDNIINSIEIASGAGVLVPEVTIFFGNKLLRGNRTIKVDAERFDAFASTNFPSLATSGTDIKYRENLILKPTHKALSVHNKMNDNVLLIKIYPGLKPSTFRNMLNSEGLEAVVLETYGAGNAPTDDWFLQSIKEAVAKGIIIVNVTQCQGGSVLMGRYETSSAMEKMGVIGGMDMTSTTALVKLMYLLGNYTNKEEIKKLIVTNLCGELTSELNKR